MHQKINRIAKKQQRIVFYKRMVDRLRIGVREKADVTRDSHTPQPGKNKYRRNGSTRRPEERKPRERELYRLIPVKR